MMIHRDNIRDISIEWNIQRILHPLKQMFHLRFRFIRLLCKIIIASFIVDVPLVFRITIMFSLNEFSWIPSALDLSSKVVLIIF